MRRRLAILALIISMLALSAGRAAAAPESDKPDSGQADARTLSTPVTSHADLCPFLYPIRLTVYAETPDELPYLSRIDACTDRQRRMVWLRNRTDLVWTPSLLVAGKTASVYGLTDDARAFASQAGLPGLGVMVPGSTVVIEAPPSWVNWRFSLGLSAAWKARNYLNGWSVETGLANASFGTRVRALGAIGTCVQAAKKAVDLAHTDIEKNLTSASSVVAQALSTGVATTRCGKGLRDLAIENRVRIPRFLDDLTAAEYTLLKRADKVMATLQRAQNAWRFLALIR